MNNYLLLLAFVLALPLGFFLGNSLDRNSIWSHKTSHPIVGILIFLIVIGLIFGVIIQ